MFAKHTSTNTDRNKMAPTWVPFLRTQDSTNNQFYLETSMVSPASAAHALTVIKLFAFTETE